MIAVRFTNQADKHNTINKKFKKFIWVAYN